MQNVQFSWGITSHWHFRSVKGCTLLMQQLWFWLLVQESNCTVVAAGLCSSVVRTRYINAPYTLTRKGEKKKVKSALCVSLWNCYCSNTICGKQIKHGQPQKNPFFINLAKRATSSQLSQADFNAEHHNVSAPLTFRELLHWKILK